MVLVYNLSPCGEYDGVSMAIFYYKRETESLIFSPQSRLYFHRGNWQFIYFTHFIPPKKLYPKNTEKLNACDALSVHSIKLGCSNSANMDEVACARWRWTPPFTDFLYELTNSENSEQSLDNRTLCWQRIHCCARNIFMGVLMKKLVRGS